MDLSHASLNSITVRSASLAELVALATDRGFGGVSLWRDTYATIGADAAARATRDAGLRVTSVCRGGMFTHGTAAERRIAWEDNLRAVDETRALGADCLVLVCGGAVDGDLARARGQISDGIAALLPYAEGAGVKLAIEPMHPMMIADRSAITSLAEANDLLDELPSPSLGIALDAYHVFWDAALEREVHRAAGRLLSIQVCDWVLPIQGQLSSRGMPGEGTIDLSAFVALGRAAGFEGLVEVEVLSDRWWREDPTITADAAVAGLTAI